MLQSLDGKINSGNSDTLDVDKDWKEIDGLKEGLQQYYDIEQETDLFCLNTGRVMEKIGINERTDIPERIEGLTFVIVDNAPHMTASGLKYLATRGSKVIIVTTNKNHPAFEAQKDIPELNILCYDELNLEQMLCDIRGKYGAERLTIQSGGTLNGAFLRADLIDYVNIVIAPVLVGGKDTSTTIDGESISSPEELNKIRPMQLEECRALNDSYVQLKYKVIHR